MSAVRLIAGGARDVPARSGQNSVWVIELWQPILR